MMEADRVIQWTTAGALIAVAAVASYVQRARIWVMCACEPAECPPILTPLPGSAAGAVHPATLETC